MSRLRRALATLVVLSQSVASPLPVWACTGITIKPGDGSIIFARTLEFALDLKSKNAQGQATRSLLVKGFGGPTTIPASAPPVVKYYEAQSG